MRLMSEPVTTNFSSFTDSSIFGPAAAGGELTCWATAAGHAASEDRQSKAACFHRFRGFIVVLDCLAAGGRPRMWLGLNCGLWSAITGGVQQWNLIILEGAHSKANAGGVNSGWYSRRPLRLQRCMGNVAAAVT